MTVVRTSRLSYCTISRLFMDALFRPQHCPEASHETEIELNSATDAGPGLVG